MSNGKYCLVMDICSILLDTRKIVLVCQDLVTVECGFRSVRYMYRCYRPPPGRSVSLHAQEDVSAQCVFLEFGNTFYVRDVPNTYRID